MIRCIALVACATLAQTAHAGFVIWEFQGAGFTIPDGVSGGGPGVASSTIVVESAVQILDLWVTVEGLSHTWAGDLTITLTSSAGTQITLVDRVGHTTPSGFGDSSDYAGDYTFHDSGADLWAAAAAAGPTDPIAPGEYSASGASGSPVSMQIALAGQNTAGLWTLTISDGFPQDAGSITGWTLSFFNIPSPSSALVFGVFAIGRRRR